MNLEQLGNAGDFLGGIAVIISLFYVAIQLRRNSQSLRASTFQAVSESFVTLLTAVSADPAALRIYMTGLQGGDLSDEEKQRFAFQLVSYMRLLESAFVQWRSGIISPEQWEGLSNTGNRILRSAGGREYWPFWRWHFSQAFREFVEETQARESRNSDQS